MNNKVETLVKRFDMAEINNTHTIQKGNTLWGIAKKNGTTVEELLKLNPQLKGQERRLQIGDKIILPGQKPSDMGTTVERNRQQPVDVDRQARARAAEQQRIAEAVAAKKQSGTTQAPQAKPSSPYSPFKKYEPQQKASKETIDILNLEIKKGGLKNVDIQYWATKIDNVSSQFNIPKEILISLIGRETEFKKNVASVNGRGAMQQTSIAIRDFFPGAKGNWSDIYKNIDEKLFNDILYKKDANGNILKDASGKPILKYKDSIELHRACANDDELSIKVGALLFKMQYAKAVARSKYGKANYTNVPKVVEQLKKGNISLSSNAQYIANAIQNYNGNPKHKYDYKRAVVDSLNCQQYDFSIPIIRA